MKRIYFFSLIVLIISLFCGCANAPVKLELIPENGIIYKSESASFSAGESAFDILKRELTNNKIHFEFNQNPVYLQGVGNIYEKDFGDMSGWVYTVNGQSPTVGCAEYFPVSGDTICFEYITSWE